MERAKRKSGNWLSILERGHRAVRHRSGVRQGAPSPESGDLSDREAGQEGALVREQEGEGRSREGEGGRALQQRKLLGADKAARQQEGLKLRGAWGGGGAGGGCRVG